MQPLKKTRTYFFFDKVLGLGGRPHGSVKTSNNCPLPYPCWTHTRTTYKHTILHDFTWCISKRNENISKYKNIIKNLYLDIVYQYISHS